VSQFGRITLLTFEVIDGSAGGMSAAGAADTAVANQAPAAAAAPVVDAEGRPYCTERIVLGQDHEAATQASTVSRPMYTEKERARRGEGKSARAGKRRRGAAERVLEGQRTTKKAHEVGGR